MSRWKIRLLVVGFVVASSIANAQTPTEAPEEARERAVMERFLSVLEKTPRRGTALDRVYGYHVERGSLDAFIKTYRDKIVADPKDGASWLLVGLVEAQRGRDSAAVEALRKAESTRPDDPLPSYYLGQALVLVGQPDSAADAFERALIKKPTRTDLLEVYQALGRVHQRAHRNDKALAVWDRLEKAFPDDPRVQEQIAHALADESQDAPALTRFEALAKSTKDRFRRVQFAVEAAELKVKLGRSAEALSDFESLLGQLDAESWLGREVRRKVEEVFLRTDDLAGLATYYENWVKKAPDDVEARARLGRVLAGQGRSAEARKWLDEAVKLAPSRRELRLALIEQLARERQFAEAAAQYETLAKLDPTNPDVVRDWGRMLLRDISKPEPDRKKAAAEVWRRLAPEDTKDAVAVAQAADLFRQANLADEAISLYQRAIKLAPDSAQYREYLGEYYHALKRSAEAQATWRASAEGKARNAKTLGRLGEVLAGFGYREEAIGPLADAIKLEPDDFDLRLKLADLKLALGRPLEALPELEKAEKLGLAEEQAEAVLDRLIQTYQNSGTLTSRIQSLEKALSDTPTAAGWTRLARLLEADQKATEAVRAIGEATRLDPKSIAAWVATARLREAAGDLLGAAEALRTLIKLDRRSRTESLTGIAKLEARLGRKIPALEAGRELLAAAPGNPENHQFFADLCFQLGEPDEGLEALRRSARANPADAKATLSLAENLAKQFRTEEAIELYWRAFARTTDLEAKLSVVGRMADQYLQRNQLDRLIGRLERELREPNQRRELSLCLAQAHASSGDFGTARGELERLLATDARDAGLLAQLSNLAEQEGDASTAAKYQKQAVDIAPSPEGLNRLAQLYVRAGEYGEAESLWTRATEGDLDPGRSLSAIDNLLAAGKRDAALLVSGRLLRTRPDDWEVLYREGVALAGLDRSAEADARFRAILALKHGDDEIGRLARSRGSLASAPSRPGPATARSSPLPIRDRLDVVPRVRLASALEVNYRGQAAFFSPLDFGQARLAAIAWRLAIALGEGRHEAFFKECREARDHSPENPRAAWDWYYLQAVRLEFRATFEAAGELVRRLPDDPAAQWAWLASLAERTIIGNGRRAFRQPGSTNFLTKAPLPIMEVDRVLACYEALQKRWPDLAPSVLAEVLDELKRAGRKDDADRVYRRAMELVAPGTASAATLEEIAAERGDDAGLLASFEKLERATGPNGPASSGSMTSAATLAQSYARTIAVRGVAKAYPEVLAILDRALIAGTRSRMSTLVATRPAPIRSNANRNNQNVVNYYLNGQNSQTIELDFPTPNDRHDQPALGTIRTAFEVFRRDDLLTDLFNHLQARADELDGAERADVLLAMAYGRWWADEKDEAEEAVARAVEAAGLDPSVRFILAEVREQKGAMAEALAAVDSVDPIDSATVMKREVQALRLAVATGDVDRARKSAERLFGLRLDSETQAELAALMNQLGMHELAEAVLARARKDAGSRLPSLLVLMQQYQDQQKAEQALQVALQILRLRPTSSANLGPRPQPPPNSGHSNFMATFHNNTAAQDDYARNQAIQALAKSGKLKELIARAEAQLDRSPNSMQVLQTLADYARFANDQEKARSLYDRMARTRPDDPRLRVQLGVQLFQGGDALGALGHFQAAVRADPSVLASQINPILGAYRQASKLEDFATLIEAVELRSIANTNAIWGIAQNLMNDEKLKERGLILFRRIWAAFPLQRDYYIYLLNFDEEWWRLPEVYDYTRELVLPPPNAPTVKPWAGADVVLSFGNDGRVVTMANRLLDAATRQDRLGELEVDIRNSLRNHPDWSSGQALLALIALRSGRIDATRAIVKELIDAGGEPMPGAVRLMIGQELEENSRSEGLAEELYEAGVRESLARPILEQANNNNNIDPSNRLLARYQASGRTDDARALILKLARSRRTSTTLDPAFVEAQRISALGNYAEQLIGLGDSGTAVTLYREQIADTLTLEKEPRSSQHLNVEGMIQQARQGIQQALRAAKPEAQGATVASLFRPGPEKPKDGEAVELYLSLDELGFDKNRVSGGIVEIFRKLVTSGKVPAEVSAGLARLGEQAPADLSVEVARSLLAFAENKPAESEAATSRLLAIVGRSPLEAIPPNPNRAGFVPRPNSRQRAEASRRLGLWLVARECWTRNGRKAEGDRLAGYALEAARRNADARWPQAMLREWGQVELDLNDREQATRRWSELLELVLARPAGLKRKLSPTKDGRPEPVAATSREAFDKAILLAGMAADRGLIPLSIQAVREAFRGGSPVGGQLGIDPASLAIGGNRPQGLNLNPSFNTLTRTGRINNDWDDGSGDAVTSPIMMRVGELEATWTLAGVEPRLIYEVLRDVVLPVGRPDDVDLYPLGLGLATAGHPRSLGDLLTERAVGSGAAQELSEAIRSRRGGPVSEMAALVLQTQLDIASGQPKAASAALRAIEARLGNDSLRASAEFAAHVGLRSLQIPELEDAAVLVLDRVLRNLATQPGLEPSITILQALGGLDLDRGRIESGRKRWGEFSALQEKAYLQNQGDPEVQGFYRRSLLIRVAAAFARRALVPDALELLGRHAEIAPTQYPELSPDGTMAALVRGLAGLPAEERYRLLKAWTLPTPGRKAVRSLVAYLSDSNIPPPEFGTTSVIPSGGVISTPWLLIEAAQAIGKLDELATDIRALDAGTIQDARTILALVEIARGKGIDALATVEGLATDHEKAIQAAGLTDPTAQQQQNATEPNPPALEALIASAALRGEDRLAAAGERLAEGLIRRPWNGQANGATLPNLMVVHLRRDLLRSQASRATGRDHPIGRASGLDWWLPINSDSVSPFLRAVPAAWFMHSGHVGVQAPNPTVAAELAFAIPLAGTFEFSVDAQALPPEGEAAVAFGGQPFGGRAVGNSPNQMFNNNNNVQGTMLTAVGTNRAYRTTGFNRVAIRSEPGRVQALVNGQVVAQESDPDPTYPWVALSGRGRAVWRDLKLTGKPTIPRQIPLSFGDRLSGWQATAFGENIAPRAPDQAIGPDQMNLDGFDWSSRDGEIRGRRMDDSAAAVALQSHLAYARPLLDGESVSYSFFHRPGRVAVHPSLGRLAFLIEPAGVRLHWLTDGPGLDPSGLAADNAINDPRSRRGPTPIPLKPDAWNQARLSLDGGKLAIELNGQIIVERLVAATDDRTFGLFHFKDRTESRVRDVILQGDWPEKFEAMRLGGLLARSSGPGNDTDGRAGHALIGEAVLTQEAILVLGRTRALPDPERFEALAAWVLPGAEHSTFRLQGEFTPLDPPPTVGPDGGRTRIEAGGDLEAPAADLVEVARSLGKLDDLAGRVTSARPGSSVDERGRLALVAMIRLAQGRDVDAVAAFDRLRGLAGTIQPNDPDWVRWPELTAARSALASPKSNVQASALAVLSVPSVGSDLKPGPSELLIRQVRRARAISEPNGRGAAIPSPWASVSPASASERGQGYPPSTWSVNGGVYSNLSGRAGEALVFRIPIRGDFQASAELSTNLGGEANFAYAGISIRVRPDHKGIVVKGDDQTSEIVNLSPPLTMAGEWAAWKLQVRQGRMIVSIDGRTLFDRPVLAEAPPWLAIQAPGVLGGSARKFALVGNPTAPDRIKLSSPPELTGWSSTEYPPAEGVGEPDWRKRGDEIFGRSRSIDLSKTANQDSHGGNAGDGQVAAAPVPIPKLESVLRYARPMLEDGEIEYEFYHESGKAMVHPTLGRLAFLIRADGVAIHRLTDGPDERTGLEPDNLGFEPGRGRAPGSPSLRPKAWNRLKLGLAGNLMKITLNDVLIDERPIDSTNDRAFGLFHFFDEGEARVREVTYRGDWPRSIPTAPLTPKD